MAIVDDGMNQEMAERISRPAPAGDYLIEATSYVKGKDKDGEEGVVIFNEKSGNTMYRINFKIVEGPYDKMGNNTDTDGVNADKLLKSYNAVWGTGFLAAFKRALPETLTDDGKVNTDLTPGLQCKARVKVSSHDGVESNEIGRLYPKNV